MSELNIPESWAETSFKNIVINEKDGFKRGPFGSALKKEFFVSDGYKVYEQKNAIRSNHLEGHYFISKEKYEELETFNVLPNDFIISCSGTLGRIYQIPKDAKLGVINQALLRLRVDNDIYIDKFFEWYFKSPTFQDRLVEEAPGSAQKNMVNVKTLKEFEMPIPPLDEQERIVNKIDSCLKKLDSIEQNLNKAEILLSKYRESLLAKAFRGELIPQESKDKPASVLLEKIREEREKNQTGKKKQEFAPISDDEKPFDIPDSWEWVPLLSITDRVGGGTPSRKEPKYFNGENLWITVADIPKKQWDVFNLSKSRKKITEEAIFNSSANLIPIGSVILSTRVSVGKVCINDVPVCTNQDFSSFINISIDRDFFAYYILFLNSYFNQKAAGATIQGINLKVIEKVCIPIPPYKEQIRISTQLKSNLESTYDCLIKINDSKVLKEKLKESILNKAFQGELVEQIESEGTGHELLEKILKAKENESPKKKVAKKKVTKKTIKIKKI